MRASWMATCLGATLLAGCSLDPDPARLTAPVPVAWPTGAAYAAASGAVATLPADQIAWQEVILDPALRRLVELALVNNRDLRIATLNVSVAEAQYRAQRGELFPSLNLTGDGNYAHSPVSPGLPVKPTTRSFSAGAGFTAYELDLFGRARSMSRSAFQSYLGEVETQRAALITLVAEVSNAYLAMVASRDLLDLAERTLRSQEESLRLTQATVAGGTATALVVQQARSAVETARASKAENTRLLAQNENALAQLIGQPVPPEAAMAASLDTVRIAEVPAGVSSDILLRRPDIMAAERQLRAAEADIGAARAAFFPSITLTGFHGSSAGALNGLFRSGTETWSFSPQITLPIFTAGINRANLDAAKLRSDIRVATYEQSIQAAFREVADALAARGTYGEQITAQRALADTAAESYRLAQLRFRAGVDSFLESLVSQRDLFSAQQALIRLRQDELASRITLYKTLGGGWAGSGE